MKRDVELWKLLKQGDRSAFEALFRTYHQDLHRFAIRFCGDRQLAEDLIQDLFVNIWQQRVSLGEVRSVRAYLWISLRRALISTQKRRRDRYSTFESRSVSDFNLPVEAFIIEREEKDLQERNLERALLSLTPRQKEVLYLKFYEGMSYEEIGEIMSINYQVARNYLSDALKKLRKEMRPVEQEAIFLLSVVTLICGPLL